MADPLPQGGQNCLRGSGPRIYSSKVLEGNWVNDQKLVTFEGNRPEVVTELQVRGAQVTGRFVPVYGASLRSTYAHIRSVENDLDYENPVRAGMRCARARLSAWARRGGSRLLAPARAPLLPLLDAPRAIAASPRPTLSNPSLLCSRSTRTARTRRTSGSA